MNTQLLLAMLSFAFVTSVTPGPNNLMLLASGASFGFRRTIPHLLGIICGMVLLLSLALAGLGSLFLQFPPAQTALKAIGIGYLLWLAWKIASAPVHSPLADSTAIPAPQGKPLNGWQALLFQFVNPKAWMMATGAVSSFTLTGEQYLASGIVLILCFILAGLPSITLWAGFGSGIQHLLTSPTHRRGFNRCMAVLTAATVFMILDFH
ncbi:MAG: LysE family translocator [Thiothrix sp.]|nr:LysE family translocator [Thiothrix sp.]HPQ96841.1 LysE family translocator [Thiolinea sp.]